MSSTFTVENEIKIWQQSFSKHSSAAHSTKLSQSAQKILLLFFIWQAIVSALCFYRGLFFCNLGKNRQIRCFSPLFIFFRAKIGQNLSF